MRTPSITKTADVQSVHMSSMTTMLSGNMKMNRICVPVRFAYSRANHPRVIQSDTPNEHRSIVQWPSGLRNELHEKTPARSAHACIVLSWQKWCVKMGRTTCNTKRGTHVRNSTRVFCGKQNERVQHAKTNKTNGIQIKRDPNIRN